MSLLNEIEDVVEKMLLTEISNEEVIRNFVGKREDGDMGNFPKNADEAPKFNVRTDTWSPIWGSANLKITRVPLDLEKDERGWSLNFNATPMLYVDKDGGIYFNNEKRSTSTTKIQTTIKNLLQNDQELSDKVREVDRETIVKLERGEEVSEDLLKKIGDEEPEPAEEVPEEETPVEDEELPLEDEEVTDEEETTEDK